MDENEVISGKRKTRTRRTSFNEQTYHDLDSSDAELAPEGP